MTTRAAVASRLADKVGNLRVFDDAEGIMNRTLLDIGGAALVVSQFTLYGDTTRGRRPSWTAAAAPEVAEPLCDAFATGLHDVGRPCRDGPVPRRHAGRARERRTGDTHARAGGVAVNLDETTGLDPRLG